MLIDYGILLAYASWHTILYVSKYLLTYVTL